MDINGPQETTVYGEFQLNVMYFVRILIDL